MEFKDNSTPYLIKIKKLLDSNYKYPLKISELARDVGVSESKLQHEFPVAFGLSILEYHLEVRMSVAKELLEATGRNLKSVAYLVGYKSAESFIRAFKKRTGMTPHRYRSRCKSVVK